MMNEIKIFNSKEKAKDLEGTLIESIKIRDGNDPIEKLFYIFRGKFTSLQRLTDVAKSKIQELKADYAVITDKYETYFNSSNHLQNKEDCDKLLTIEVNFYKRSMN